MSAGPRWLLWARPTTREPPKRSAHYLAEFKITCRTYLPRITDYGHQMDALTFVQDTLKRLRAEAKSRQSAA
jgi:hypothetical protein